MAIIDQVIRGKHNITRLIIHEKLKEDLVVDDAK